MRTLLFLTLGYAASSLLFIGYRAWGWAAFTLFMLIVCAVFWYTHEDNPPGQP